MEKYFELDKNKKYNFKIISADNLLFNSYKYSFKEDKFLINYPIKEYYHFPIIDLKSNTNKTLKVLKGSKLDIELQEAILNKKKLILIKPNLIKRFLIFIKKILNIIFK